MLRLLAVLAHVLDQTVRPNGSHQIKVKARQPTQERLLEAFGKINVGFVETA